MDPGSIARSRKTGQSRINVFLLGAIQDAKIKEHASIFKDLKNGMFFRHIKHCAFSSNRIIKNGIGDNIARAKGSILPFFKFFGAKLSSY